VLFSHIEAIASWLLIAARFFIPPRKVGDGESDVLADSAASHIVVLAAARRARPVA
jgi:hypothetical protein